MKLFLLMGSHLFPKKHLAPFKDMHFFMAEDFGLCTEFKIHKHKIMLFLLAMRKKRDELKDFDLSYFKIEVKESFFKNLKTTIKAKKISELHCFEIEDAPFAGQLKDFCKKQKVTLIEHPSALFLFSKEDFETYLGKSKKPFMKSFYEQKRRELDILMEDGSPIGGKYSFDSDNRKKLPKNIEIPSIPKFSYQKDSDFLELKEFIDTYLSDHPGELDNFWLPVTRRDALKWLDAFLKERFHSFGDYEDAFEKEEHFLFHSLLSPIMNMGLVTPHEVLQRSLSMKGQVDLNQLEGFIRQVMGWREFIKGIYDNYSDVQESTNFFNHQRKLTKAWYTGDTGIEPLDDCIKKLNQYGYTHHIERLMVLSNLMLLCEIDPKEVHRWFMEMYVDSAHWVMGPNVYGMGQFSDGGIFATKPYVCSSNYLLKMSHYKKGEWCEVMDGLYWRFIDQNREFFQKNYRMKMMVSLLDKMDPEKKRNHLKNARKFLSTHTKK